MYVQQIIYIYSNCVSTYMNITCMDHATPSGHRFQWFFFRGPQDITAVRLREKVPLP